IPQAVALSKIAVSGSIHPSSPDTGSPNGPVILRCSRSDPGASTASSNPSPPSEIGHCSTAAPGNALRAPAEIASATCRGPRVPLKAAGATRITSGILHYVILVAPAAFKGTLGPRQVAEAIS